MTLSPTFPAPTPGPTNAPTNTPTNAPTDSNTLVLQSSTNEYMWIDTNVWESGTLPCPGEQALLTKQQEQGGDFQNVTFSVLVGAIVWTSRVKFAAQPPGGIRIVFQSFGAKIG